MQPIVIQSRRPPLRARVAEQVASTLGLARWWRLDVDAIRTAAAAKLGYDPPLDGVEDPLELLLGALRGRSPWTLGRILAAETFTSALVNRARVRAALARSTPTPDVERPLFVLGLHRSGTTFVHTLLDQCADQRALRFWELMEPAPPAGRDTRRLSARVALAAHRFLAPEMAVVHPVAFDAPEECWPLFMPTLSVANLALQHDVPAYADWLWARDMRPAYRFYRDALSLLLGQRPARSLVLKCPEHLWFLDALLDTFPDAQIVWMHRDPATCAASYTSLAALQRRTVLGHFEPDAVHAHVAAGFDLGLARARAARDPGDPRFLDVQYEELVADPVGTVARIQTHFGRSWTPEDAAAVRAWLAANPPAARPVHRYAAPRA